MGGIAERVLVAVMLFTVLRAASQHNKGNELSFLKSRQRELVHVKERANPLPDPVSFHRSRRGDSGKRGSDACACPNSRVTSCLDWLRTDRRSGVRTIYVYGEPISVYCEQTTDGGGWTVFQRRVDGSTDFYRNWTDYVNGFGDLNRNFWLGLDKLHSLTRSKRYELRVDLQMWNGTETHATYSGFYVEGVGRNFALRYDNFTGGNAGDSLKVHRGLQFSTWDRDHDTYPGNCAVSYHGAWWYRRCHTSNLNGDYKTNSSAPRSDGLNWRSLFGTTESSVKFSEMKIRPM